MKQILIIVLLLMWTRAGYGASAPWRPADGFGGILIAILFAVLLTAAINWYSNKKNPTREKIDSSMWFKRIFWFGSGPFETIDSPKKKKKGKKGKT